jgi:proteasome lid subunit RPN8/RPN11
MLVIRKADFETVIDHCKREYPNEACGILAGNNGAVAKVYALANAEPSPSFYLVDAADQFRVMKEMRSEGLDLAGIYHSHTVSPAYPSATDVGLAYYPEAVYVIVSLMDPARPEARAFTIVEEKITEVELEVRAEGADARG